MGAEGRRWVLGEKRESSRRDERTRATERMLKTQESDEKEEARGDKKASNTLHFKDESRTADSTRTVSLT